MKHTLLISTFMLGFVAACFSQSINKDELAIKQILNNQQEAWNRGSVNEFMQGYWQSDGLLFIGKNGPRYGYQNALNNYKRSYPDTIAMGKLNFNIMQVKRLSVLYFFVVGKWQLTRTIGNVEGYFTLLFKKIKGEWLIVSDHSS